MITIGILTLSEYAKQAKNVVDSINLDENCEVVLVDNGMKNEDGVDEVDLVYHAIENLGIAPSWNLLTDMAFMDLEEPENNSEIVIILNDDIVLHEDSLELLVRDIRENDYDIVTGYMVNDPDNFSTAKIEPRFIPGMHFACFAITKRCAEVMGPFDSSYAPCYVEDTDYYHRLLQTDLKYGCDRWAKFKHSRFLNRQDPWVRQSHQKNRDYFTKKWGVPPKATFRKMSAGRKEL
jgi:GT2 family glycosyltransferase